jgi:hypothetical protein
MKAARLRKTDITAQCHRAMRSTSSFQVFSNKQASARTSTAKSLPLRFATEYGYSAMQLSHFLGCEGEVAEIGSLVRGAFSPEDE